MVPPKISTNDKSFLDWAPGRDDAAVDAQDCSNCHTSPKPQGNFGFQNQANPFFVDRTKKSKSVLSPQDAAALQAWVAGISAPADPANPPVAKSAPIQPTAPTDAASLGDHAKELERQARLCLDPEKKLAFYQSALGLRLLAGDAKATTAVLDELQAAYKKSGHAAGEKFVAALRLWADGKAEASLKALADMEKEVQGSAYTFYQAYGAQRSLLLQVAAGEKLKQSDYPGAKALLLDALRLTPSNRLTSKVLKLMAEHGEADLFKQSLRLADLEAQREKLTTPPVRCNGGCHSANKPDPFKDFQDYRPLLKDEFGQPLFQGPDLSAYRKFTHLTHAQKLQLHALDQEIGELRTKYLGSLEEVRTLLFTKTLDDPKADLAVLEEKALKDAVAFTGPDRSLPWQLAGEAYLAKQDYAKAVGALEAAVREDPSRVDAQFALGKARFATGDFKGSRDAYTAILAHQPQDVIALRYRADANSQYLSSLDPKQHTEEITKVEGELASDRALLLARYNAAEKEKIANLGKELDRLREGGDAALETRQETLNMLELLAKQYLALAETHQAGVPQTELVRKELNGLAAETFDLLAKFAKADTDPAIKQRAGLYEGYSRLAKGEVDEATKVFEPLRKDFPEIERILGTLEKSKLRMMNLAALEAWETYNKEGAAVQADAQSGVLGWAIGGVESWFRDDGKDFRDDTKARWKGQVAFVAELRSRIESGRADTMLQAMEQIEKDGPEAMKADARYYIEYRDVAMTGYPLGALVHLVDKLPPEPGEAERLLNKTWDLERQNPAVEAPYALYTVVNFLDKEASFNGTARQHMDALEGHGSFGRSAFKFITSMSPETLAVDVLLMVGSAGLGNLAKLAALSKLEKAGVTGYKAIVLAGAAGVGVEATALWAANLGKEAMLRDPSKVFTQEHMLKSYGSTLIMIGGLKGAGKLGETVAPRAAKSLGMVTAGGTKLTSGGKILAWGIGHGTGLGGMIATSHINQAAGLAPKPIGGWKEGLVHDVFGYVQFAVAHKIADRAFSGKLSTFSQKQHSEIAIREAILSAKSYADALGFRATHNAKGEIADSPARKLVVGLLVDSALNKPGFSGGKLAKLVESRKFEQANEYFAEFGLPLEYNKSGELIAVARGEASPHAAAGIPAGKAKPAPKPVAADLYAKQLAEKAVALLDKAAEWLFGPPDGGFGGMQPAYAGAYGAAKVRAKTPEPPKGPPTVFMSGKGEGSGKGKGKSSGKTPATPVNLPAEKVANDNPNREVVPHTLKEGENFDAALGTLCEHFSDPSKIIVIEALRPTDKADVIAEKIGHYDPTARVEVHLPDGTKVVVEPKLSIDRIHQDVLSDGTQLYWESGQRSVRDLFRVTGKKGEVPLVKPDGITRIEIKPEKPLAQEDLAFLLGEAKRLGVEIVVDGERQLSFRATKDGLEIRSDKQMSAEELNGLVQHVTRSGENIEVVTKAGKISIQKGAGTKDTAVTTKDSAAALLAPELVTLVLDKAPTVAELQALQTGGLRKLRFQDDPKAPGWALSAIEAMKHCKGMNVRASEASGKLLWENAVRADGEFLQTQPGIFQEMLRDHANASGWIDRLAEMQKLLGPEGVRFDFGPDALRWAAAQDLSQASIPPGGKTPAVPAAHFELWLKRGMDLAAFKHGKAVEKGKIDLAREMNPFAEGFKADPKNPDAWSRATGKMKEFLQRHRDNPTLLAKAFGYLNRDAVGTEAYENNAYDLAKFFVESENPYLALKNLSEVYQKSSGNLKLQGNLFGTFLKMNDLGAKREQDTVKKLIADAETLTAQGHEVVIEAIPTNKFLDGTTPDFAMTVTQGGVKTRYFVEVKKVAAMTVAKGTKESFSAELEATFNNPGKKSDEASLGSQMGKGLAQLNRYSGKGSGDTLVLNLHLDGAPPPYFRKILTKFLAAHCPNIVVKVQYRETQSYSPSGSAKIEVRTVDVETMIRADSATKYSNYDFNTNFFAPSLSEVVAAE
ncbi:MAG: tetratricopeptide repeat protein [Deltaproteobacteria bacterium]|nr:tetratricopeptide repeat protein [Deltaproteobacteria bacterium]